MKLRASVGLIALLLAQTASAHVGNHAADGGFLGGVAHPLVGADHLLAMFAIGLCAAQSGGRAMWAMPLAFVAAMAAGALLAFGGVALPAVEAGVAASVLALGLLVAFAARMPLAAGVLLAAVFAMFHGYAHASEFAGPGSPAAYALGFLAATAVLHVVGVTAGFALGGRRVQAIGACVAVAGVAFLANA